MKLDIVICSLYVLHFFHSFINMWLFVWCVQQKWNLAK